MTEAKDKVVVYTSIVRVSVAIPEGKDADDLERELDDRYEAISDAVDVRDAVKTRLTDKGGPLEGYDVEVKFL